MPAVFAELLGLSSYVEMRVWGFFTGLTYSRCPVGSQYLEEAKQ